MIRLLGVWVLLASFLFCSSSISAQPPLTQQERYARYLVAEGDFFRAAGKFKELAYFADTDSLRLTYLLWTGRCERWRDETNAAIRYASHVANHTMRNPRLRSKAHLDIGITELQRGQTLFARTHLTRAEDSDERLVADMFLAVAAMREGNWTSASSSLAALKSEGQGVGMLSLHLDSLCKRGARGPYKNPLVAGVLSTLIPGAGQTYSYHYIDGIQAFTLVGAFAYMSFVAYKYEHDRHGHPGGLFAVSVGITSVFHLANIIGANKTAHYHNMRLMMDPVNEAFRAVDEYYRESLLR